MSAEVVRLHPDAQDYVVFDSTTRFLYPDVENFLVEAEKLYETHNVALYCTMLAGSCNAPLGGEYAIYFPEKHPWLIDPRQELVAKRLVTHFYHPRPPQSTSSAKMTKIEGVISKFHFEYPNRRIALMHIYEGII